MSNIVLNAYPWRCSVESSDVGNEYGRPLGFSDDEMFYLYWKSKSLKVSGSATMDESFTCDTCDISCSGSGSSTESFSWTRSNLNPITSIGDLACQDKVISFGLNANVNFSGSNGIDPETGEVTCTYGAFTGSAGYAGGSMSLIDIVKYNGLYYPSIDVSVGTSYMTSSYDGTLGYSVSFLGKTIQLYADGYQILPFSPVQLYASAFLYCFYIGSAGDYYNNSSASMTVEYGDEW